MAPTKETIKLPIKPSLIDTPARLNIAPPSSAPKIPTMILVRSQKPFPLIIFPASHPANAPMIINTIQVIIR